METHKKQTVENKLTFLHNDASKDHRRIRESIPMFSNRPLTPYDFRDAYLPISQEQGVSIRKLILENESKHVVEFGTSFGISTIYMADAVKETGGKVISTELIRSKAEKALENIKDVGLESYVDIRVGDAMETLKHNSTPIDFLFLDGWKDLYLPLFRMLEPQFHKGTLIYADNMDMEGTQRYSNYLMSKKDDYKTKAIHGGKAYLSMAS